MFKRGQSGTRITSRGMQLQPYAEKPVAISTEMKAQFRTNVPKQGTLPIGIADALAYLWLDVLSQKWRAQYSLIFQPLNVTFKFHTSNSVPGLLARSARQLIDKHRTSWA